MRPIERGPSPRDTDFDDYREAYPDLVSRLGAYCSYCERRISTQLAVEHIQPKADGMYPKLQGRWDNFLLGCVNCNSTKKDKDVVLSKLLLPDRDNTAFAYEYLADGTIEINLSLSEKQQKLAATTLSLTGLDKPKSEELDENGKLVAIDRVSQRMEAWLIADLSRINLKSSPGIEMQKQVVLTATQTGFFSIWMTVFNKDRAMRRRFIEAFGNTARDCFDSSTKPVTPRPSNGLKNGGKV